MSTHKTQSGDMKIEPLEITIGELLNGFQRDNMRRPDAPETAISKMRWFKSGRCWPSMGLTWVAQNFRPHALHW